MLFFAILLIFHFGPFFRLLFVIGNVNNKPFLLRRELLFIILAELFFNSLAHFLNKIKLQNFFHRNPVLLVQREHLLHQIPAIFRNLFRKWPVPPFHDLQNYLADALPAERSLLLEHLV